MNDERMPINLYKLDSGENDKGMNGKELINYYKQNIHKWYFIAVADIVFAMIVAFVNLKTPDMTMVCMIIYIAAFALLIVSIVRLHRYHLQYKSIKEEFNS